MLIHCDYCGSAFDPEKNATCPSCGAAWAGDKEAERVRAREEQKARIEQEQAEAEKFAVAADSIRRTVDSAGRAFGGLVKIIRVIFLAIFLMAMLFFLFTFARVIFHF